jgi:hypothetical protein
MITQVLPVAGTITLSRQLMEVQHGQTLRLATIFGILLTLNFGIATMALLQLR